MMDCSSLDSLYLDPGEYGYDCYITDLHKDDNDDNKMYGLIYCNNDNGENIIQSNIRFIKENGDENHIEDNEYSLADANIKTDSGVFNIAEFCGYKTVIVSYYYYILEDWSIIQNIMTKYDSNFNKNNKDFSVPGNIYRGAETFDDIFLAIIKIFENNNFSDIQNDDFLFNISVIINDFKMDISDSYYNNHAFLRNIDEETIHRFEIYFKIMCDLLGENNTNNSLIDYHYDGGSKYFMTRLLTFINKLVFKINEMDGFLNYGLGVRIDGDEFSMDINYETIDKDANNLEDAIERLAKRIQSIDSRYKSVMEEYYEELYELNNIINKSKNQINKELIYNLLIAIQSYIDGTDDYEKNKVVISEDNNRLSLEGIFYMESTNINDVRYYEKIPMEVIPYIFKGITHEIIKNGNNNEEIINFLLNIQHDIDKINYDEINKTDINIKKESRRSLDHYLILLAEYNNIAASTIIKDVSANNGEYITTRGFGYDIINKVLYNYNKDLNEAIQSIINANPKIFNKYFENPGRDIYHWDYYNNSEEFNDIDLKMLIKKVPYNDISRAELMKIFIVNADPLTILILNRAYNTKYLYVRCFAEEMNPDNYEDILINADMITLSIQNAENIQPFTEYRYNTLFDFLEVMRKYDKSHIYIDGDKFEISKLKRNSYYGYYGYEEMFNEILPLVNSMDDNEFVDEGAKKLNVYIRGLRYKLAQYVGKTSVSEFFNIDTDYSEIVRYATEYFIINKNHGNESDIDIECLNECNINTYLGNDKVINRLDDINRKIGTKRDSKNSYKFKSEYLYRRNIINNRGIKKNNNIL